jgi:hypothetical protein
MRHEGGNKTMPVSRTQFPVLLTQAQRKVVAEVAPELVDRLNLNEQNQRTIAFNLAELKAIIERAGRALPHASTGMKRNSLRHVADIAAHALERSQGIGMIPVSERLYQFRITLLNTQPPIWRRIQIKDCTLDKLHEHIQTAMGWSNSHLHHFKVGEQLFGDPMLMEESFAEMNYEDSTSTKISDILPKNGKPFRFDYEYDFGDSWEHEVLFEGCVRTEQGKRYPLCLEGVRACPPEDVGGTWGYQGFLDAITDPHHEEHEEYLRWVGGQFDPDAFDAVKATKRMKRGLPDWRRTR